MGGAELGAAARTQPSQSAASRMNPTSPILSETPRLAKVSWHEELFRRLVETLREYAVIVLDPEGRISTWNEGAERILGYDRDEVAGRHFAFLLPQSAAEKGWPQHEIETARRLGSFEDEGWRLRKDGTRFWASAVITALREGDGVLRGFSKITRDLTERRRQDEELRHSEERWRLLLEGIEDYAICMLDPEGRVASWNSGAQAILQYRAYEVIGESFERFHAPEDIAAGRARDLLRDAALNRRTEEHALRVRKDGTRFWADTVITAMHGADGRLRGFAAVTRDMSSRKRMEELEEQGRHLTEFLAMLAHELRNPLAPIRNALGIMAATEEPSRLAWCRGVIERQAAQLTRLVDDLLDVSRITRGKLRMQNAVIDLNAAVQRALETARPLIDARGHRLDVRRCAGALRVHGDLARLAQVVINLLTNAAKYTPEGGQIRADVDAEDGDAVIRVRDSGVGIAPA